MTEPCGPEIATLKDNIRKLENKLLLTTWQIGFLRNTKYFKPVQPRVPKAEFEPEAGSKEMTNGTADSPDTALTKPLSPAGSLIVYDKGDKIVHVFSCMHIFVYITAVFNVKCVSMVKCVFQEVTVRVYANIAPTKRFCTVLSRLL